MIGALLYQRRGSWAESWDPRAKLLFVLFLGLDLMIDHRPGWMVLRAAAILLLWMLSRLPWRLLGYTLLSLSLLFVSTMVYHVYIVPGGDPGSGLVRGAMMCLQILGFVLLLGFLVYTTPPLVLAEGMEALLSPLKRLRVPVHEAVMIFTIALRFLPILAGEFDKVRKAQIARGAGFHRGRLSQRLRGLLPLLVPVMVQALMRAEELATAMEARCYRGDVGRTRLRCYRMGAADWAVVAVGAACLVSGLTYAVQMLAMR